MRFGDYAEVIDFSVISDANPYVLFTGEQCGSYADDHDKRVCDTAGWHRTEPEIGHINVYSISLTITDDIAEVQAVKSLLRRHS